MNKKANIMIVEDDAVIAISTRMVLEELGYDVSSMYASGEEAIERIEEEKPDVVLMDMKLLGKMDGIETAAHVTSNFHVPVILLTAYSDNGTLSQVKDMGIQYLRKPASSDEFRSAIEQALNGAG